MKKLLSLLVLLFFFSNNIIVVYADNRMQTDDDYVCFNLVEVESRVISIKQYDYNYFYLYKNGVCEFYSSCSGQRFSMDGYWTFDKKTKKISLFTGNRIPYYFISPDEHVYMDIDNIIVTGTLYGKYVKFVYKRLE